MIRILVVDDRSAVRQGLRMWLGLEPDLEIAGEAATPGEALLQATMLQPDVIVIDVETPELADLALVQQLRATAPMAAILILTLHDSEILRLGARRAGATTLVAKHESSDVLLAAVRQIGE